MKIIIMSSGRSHLLDCARELQFLGHEVAFISYTPQKYMRKGGLSKGGSSLFLPMAPLVLLHRKFIHIDWITKITMLFLDFLASFFVKKCDVFIAQCPFFSRTMRLAKKKGALCILDKGTSYAEIYNSLLKDIGARVLEKKYIELEIKQCQEYDRIAIPSEFVYDGFQKKGKYLSKLIVNPYGVNLDTFYPVPCTNEFDCIVVGQWSLRKGSHFITKAFSGSSIKILHVGSIGIDTLFPNVPNFYHVDDVNENTLPQYYAKAKMFLFPSIEDGFGLVLLQAAACGLPILCSANCGGPTIKKMIEDNKCINILPSFAVDSLKNGVFSILEQINKGMLNRERPRNFEKHFSWHSYGERYESALMSIIQK